MDFEYFYNREAERFNFLKVPEILVDREEFRGLSAEAIILYSILLKQTGMSFKNNGSIIFVVGKSTIDIMEPIL
ncbi:replication initiator protein A, partial [Streptococcus pneumoniae]|uniref:replication initiator protein A n=2 Tax=Streptococcus pneumoniae TaxID=1313 RepID=UPI000AD1D162